MSAERTWQQEMQQGATPGRFIDSDETHPYLIDYERLNLRSEVVGSIA
jgi:hypothetical protein